jgi:putative inorganic carbon (HCO3(-)) transporter
LFLTGLLFNFGEAWGESGIFFSIEFALLICLSFFGPKYAISFFIYLLLSRPWETIDNQLMESMPRDIFYLTALVLVAYKIIRKEFFFRFNLGSLFLGCFAAWVFLSAFFSGHQSDAIRMYVEIFSKGVIVFFLIQNGFRKSDELKIAKLTLVLAILEKSIISIYQTYLQSLSSHGVEEEYQRLESVGILSNSNDIAAIFILAIPFVLYLVLKTRLRPFSWLTATGLISLMSVLVWKSQSRGALLALVATFAAYFFLKIKNKKQIAIVLALTLGASLVSFSLMNRKAEDVEGSTKNRIIFWKAGANMAIRNPIFGVGFWGFNQNFASYAIDGDTGSESRHMTAHSSWVQVMAENGFIGLFFFLGLWLYSMFKAYQIRERHPEYFMSLVGYGVTITFLSHAYLLFPYILCALAITQSSLEQEENVIELNEHAYALKQEVIC